MKMRAPSELFDRLVDATVPYAQDAPGFIVGISGTDSILAFLVCYRAMERIGRGNDVLGVHFGAVWPPENKSAGQLDKLIALSPNYNWVSRIILPWLAGSAPAAKLAVKSQTNDYHRWAELHRIAAEGTLESPEARYWVVGTQNHTEKTLGLYSNISTAVSLQPIDNVWKSEVLDICTRLGVPQVAIEHSRQADCDCGRDDLAAAHISEIDAILKHKRIVATGAIVPDMTEMDPGLLETLQQYIEGYLVDNKFKKAIPYRLALS